MYLREYVGDGPKLYPRGKGPQLYLRGEVLTEHAESGLRFEYVERVGFSISHPSSQPSHCTSRASSQLG